VKTTAIVTAIVVGLSQTAFGQTRGLGFVQGKIIDEKGAPLQDVTFTATLPRVRMHLTGNSNEKGEWKILGMAHGEWDIAFEKRGFARGRVRVTLDNELARIPSITVRMKTAE